MLMNDITLLQRTSYLAMSREDETRENWESFNEFKDLYMASLNLHSVPEGLQIHRYKFIKDEIMCTYISKMNLKDKSFYLICTSLQWPDPIFLLL